MRQFVERGHLPIPARSGGALRSRSVRPLPAPVREQLGHVSLPPNRSLAHVRVHYDSPGPALIGAVAYTWGRHIHLASGAEAALPHEARHVVQQFQGRVRPDPISPSSLPVATASDLEQEAEGGLGLETVPVRAPSAPVLQPKVRFTGLERTELDKVASRVDKLSSARVTLDESGYLELADRPQEPDAFTANLGRAVDSDQEIPLRFVRANDEVRVDEFKTGRVDIDDLTAYPDEVFRLRFLHFLAERAAVDNYEQRREELYNQMLRDVAVKGMDVDKTEVGKAHQAGFDAEAMVLRELYPDKSIFFVGERVGRTDVDAEGRGTQEYVFDYNDVHVISIAEVVDSKVTGRLLGGRVDVIGMSPRD